MFIRDLIVIAIGDYTSPLKRILNLIDLQTSPAVGAQRVNLLARKGVNEYVLAVEEVVYRHHVCFAICDTAEAAQALSPENRDRLTLLQLACIHLLLFSQF